MITDLLDLTVGNVPAVVYGAIASALVAGILLGCIGLWVGAIRGKD